MDQKLKEVSGCNDKSERSVLTWQWFPSEGSTSSMDSLASGDTSFSPSWSQCSPLQKLTTNSPKGESPLSVDEESATELRKEHLSTVSYEELQSSRVKLMCSFGGRIIPRPSDGKLRCVGGETRILSVNRDIHFTQLMIKLTKLYGEDLFLKYQLPGEDLDALVSVSSDEDLENMMEEYDGLEAFDCNIRLRVFIFPVFEDEQANHFDSRASDHLYVDAVNGIVRSCSRKPSDMGLLADAHPCGNHIFGRDNVEVDSPWAGESVSSPSQSRRTYDFASETNVPITQGTVYLQSVSNPPSAPQSAPSSPSFLSQPFSMNKVVSDPPFQNLYEPQLKVSAPFRENFLPEMTNQGDEFSCSASSSNKFSNKDTHNQVSELRKAPNLSAAVRHEIYPTGFHHAIPTQTDHYRMNEDMISRINSPHKVYNLQEQHVEFRPSPMLIDSESNTQPLQNSSPPQAEPERLHLQNQDFQSIRVCQENTAREQCRLYEARTFRVHTYAKPAHFEKHLINRTSLDMSVDSTFERHRPSEVLDYQPSVQPHRQMQPNLGVYIQGSDRSMQHSVTEATFGGGGGYPYGEFGNLHEQYWGHQAPNIIINNGGDFNLPPQSIFEKDFMQQLEQPNWEHDANQDRREVSVSHNMLGRSEGVYPVTDVEHFPQQRFALQQSQNATSNWQATQQGLVQKLDSFGEKQQHQGDPSRNHCKPYNPLSQAIANDSLWDINSSFARELGSAPSSPQPGHRGIYDRQTGQRLPAQWNQNEPPHDDQQFFGRSPAIMNEQSISCQMPSSPPVYTETAKNGNDCQMCLQDLARERVFIAERYLQRLGNRRDWLWQQRVVLNEDDPRAVGLKLTGSSSQQGELFNERGENLQKDLSEDLLICTASPPVYTETAKDGKDCQICLQGLARERDFTAERYPQRLGNGRDWLSQQRVVVLNEDDPRVIDLKLTCSSSQQGELLNERGDYLEKELSEDLLICTSSPRTFAAYANENGYQPVPRRNYWHETSEVPEKSMPYHPTIAARPSTVTHTSTTLDGLERYEFSGKRETSNWSNVTLQEPEYVADAFENHSHNQILIASASLSPLSSILSKRGALEMGTVQCHHQQDFQNYKTKLAKSDIRTMFCDSEELSCSCVVDCCTVREAMKISQFPRNLHDLNISNMGSIRNPSFSADCNITCSSKENPFAVLQPEGTSSRADSLKLFPGTDLSTDQQLPEMHGDDVTTESVRLENIFKFTPNSSSSAVSIGCNSSINNFSFVAAGQPIENVMQRNLEPATSLDVDVPGVDIKYEENFALAENKKSLDAKMLANKALAQEMTFCVVDSNGSQETFGVTKDEVLQLGPHLKVDEAAKNQTHSVGQQILPTLPSFLAQAPEKVLETAASFSSQIEGDMQCEKISRVAKSVAERPFNTDEEKPFEVCKDEPDQVITSGDTNCSMAETASAAAAKATAGGLQTIKNSYLEEIRELGSGNFGTVYHGKWRGSDVAIKRIKESCFTGRPSERERLLADFWKEANTLSQLHHPNVVAFYGLVPDGPGGTLATVTEYMVNGSLKQVLQKKDRTIDRRKRLLISMDAAFGMEYLHGKNIVHFDLKCENLLVNMKDPHRPICKVGDLGLSKVKQQTMVSGGVRGTLPWMAPELLSGKSNMVTEKIDVFSFGIVMWELLTGEEPYANMHYGAVIGGIVNNTLRPPVPNWCDPAWRSLMENCWAADPVIRPSFADIVNELRTLTESLQPKPQRPVHTVCL